MQYKFFAIGHLGTEREMLMMSTVKRFFTPSYANICGLLSFIIYMMSFLIGYEEEASNHLFLYFKLILIFLSAFLFLFACSSKSSERIKAQYAGLCLVILVFQGLLFVAVGRTILYIHDYAAILNSIMWIGVCAVSIVRYRNNLFRLFSEVFMNRDNLILIASSLVLSLIVIILSAEPTGVAFTLDSNSMFGFVYRLGFESFYYEKQTTFHSHVSFVYGQIIVLFKLLFGSIYAAFFAMNSLCAVTASLGTTFLLRHLLPGKKKILYVLGTAMFMLSPWVCGMSTYYMYDYYIWCLFPLLILFALRRNWTGFFVIGLMITFSKSSGLAVFGSVCVSVVLTDLLANIAEQRDAGSVHPVICGVLRIISDIKNWYFLSIAVVFAIFFKMGISTKMKYEDVVFGLDWVHLSNTLLMYMTANFMWIFVAATLILIFGVFISRRIVLPGRTVTDLRLLLISDLIFILFNCVCITFRIPRYMDCHISTVYICTAVLLISVNRIGISSALMGLITAVTFVGAFRTVDPVSLALFYKVNVGDHDIITFNMESPGDALSDDNIYNRDYYSYEILLYDALTYVLSDRQDGDEIMMSLGGNANTWGFSGARYAYDIRDGKHYFTLFYDKDRHTLANVYDYEYYDSDNMIPIEMHYIFREETVSDAVSMSDSKVFYYIYMPTMNESKEAEIAEKYSILDEKEFSFRGWKMNCIKFTKEH